MSFLQLFEDYAAFYREQYLPFLIEEGFIDEGAEDTEFAEAFDLEPLANGAVEAMGVTGEFRTLLSEVGCGSVLFPTEEGPARFGIIGPNDDRDHWKQQIDHSLTKVDGKAVPPAAGAIPVLIDDGGGLVAFVVADNDPRVFAVTYTGKLFGPSASLSEFFAAFFTNARENRMPFDGM